MFRCWKLTLSLVQEDVLKLQLDSVLVPAEVLLLQPLGPREAKQPVVGREGEVVFMWDRLLLASSPTHM